MSEWISVKDQNELDKKLFSTVIDLKDLTQEYIEQAISLGFESLTINNHPMMKS